MYAKLYNYMNAYHSHIDSYSDNEKYVVEINLFK